eukprot:maker-scaffold6387_size3907-snap-gene-0.4 protein:Tk09739 transcript:maker-scaffold6387_size3907-snap-gene-0.4-mRNA-1 annotation:"atp-dependent protease"
MADGVDQGKDDSKLLYCSFCGKSQHEVRKLIAGPSVFICDECVDLCNDIITEEMQEQGASTSAKLPKPREIKEIVDQYVIGQDAAKRILSVAVYNHYKRLEYQGGKDDVELAKSNILLLGPTGSGKTLLAETLARLLNVPFTIADATTLTEAGYVKTKDDSQGIGDLLHEIQADDLVRFGLIPEFVGRLPVIATLEELDEEALVRILREPKNALTKQYEKLFALDGIELEFKEDALYSLAKQAAERKTGARGLRTILEKVLLETMYEVPSQEDARKVIIDDAVVRGEAKPYVVLGPAEDAANESEKASFKRAASDD